jgi:NCAIR mutase (PurE)-related protein
MKNTNGTDVLKIFDAFQKSIQKKPTYEQMVEEVRMMKFKVRPMQGDILLFNLKDEGLIEILWNLGKLDELFQNKYAQLSKKDKGVFFRIFDSMYQRYQTELSKINLRKDKTANVSPTVEMEIFKEQRQKKLN